MRFFFRSLSLSPHQTFSPKQKPSLPLSTSCRLSLLHRLRPRPQDHQPAPAPRGHLRVRRAGSGACPLGPRRVAEAAGRSDRRHLGRLPRHGDGAVPGAVVRGAVRGVAGARGGRGGDVCRKLRVLPVLRKHKRRKFFKGLLCQPRPAAAEFFSSSLQALFGPGRSGRGPQVEGRHRGGDAGRGEGREGRGEGEQGGRDADRGRRSSLFLSLFDNDRQLSFLISFFLFSMYIFAIIIPGLFRVA